MTTEQQTYDKILTDLNTLWETTTIPDTDHRDTFYRIIDLQITDLRRRENLPTTMDDREPLIQIGYENLLTTLRTMEENGYLTP